MQIAHVQSYKYSDQYKKMILRDLCSFLIGFSSELVLWLHLRCFIKTHAKQHRSSDALFKFNNSACFYVPILSSANLKYFHTVRLLWWGSNKRSCQLTRWKNILLIFVSPSISLLSWHGGLTCRDEGRITACLGEAWHKTGCHWHDEPEDCWQILVMSLPDVDSSDTLVWGQTRKRRSWRTGRGGVWKRRQRWWVGAWWEETLVPQLCSSSVFFNVPAFIDSRSCQQ